MKMWICVACVHTLTSRVICYLCVKLCTHMYMYMYVAIVSGAWSVKDTFSSGEIQVWSFPSLKGLDGVYRCSLHSPKSCCFHGCVNKMLHDAQKTAGSRRQSCFMEHFIHLLMASCSHVTVSSSFQFRLWFFMAIFRAIPQSCLVPAYLSRLEMQKMILANH